MQRAFVRIAAALLAIVVVFAGAARAARADVPGNDDIAGAVPFSTLPFTFTEDVSEATSDASDPSCPFADNSVWFRFTPASDSTVLLDTSGSDADMLVTVATGAPGALSVITCGQLGGTFLEAEAGTTYFIMISAFPFGDPPGTLVFSARVSPFTVTIGKAGTFDPRTGTATIGAQIACAEEAIVLSAAFFLDQRAGHVVVHSSDTFVSVFDSCGPDHPISMTTTVTSFDGLYRAGAANAQALFGVAIGSALVTPQATATIKLLGH